MERCSLRNPELFDNFKQQIIEYVKKGYAHKITTEQMLNSDPRNIWYLSLRVVGNPKSLEKFASYGIQR